MPPTIPGPFSVIALPMIDTQPDVDFGPLPGLAPNRGVRPLTELEESALPRYDDPMRRVDRSPLIDILPQFSTIEAGWDGALPAFPAPFTIATGECAWFGLQRVRIPEDVAQEIMLYGIDVDLLPTDSDGTGGASSVAWGTTKGSAAAIVIGQDLPINLGNWVSAPAFVPRVEASGAGALTATRIARQLRTTNFPSGKYTDATPQRLVKSWNFAPGGWRFPYGSSLDVALVVRKSQAEGVGARIIYGSGLVSLTVFRTFSRADFSQ